MLVRLLLWFGYVCILVGLVLSESPITLSLTLSLFGLWLILGIVVEFILRCEATENRKDRW